VEVGVPTTGGVVVAEITADAFTRCIWEPATRAMAERRIEDHVLAWIYSVGFPIRIAGNPPLSIQGLTFLRNRAPDSRAVQDGTYASPLFAGPDGPGQPAFGPQTFDVHRNWMGEDMPLPSMMLGYLGDLGNSEAEIVRCLERGVAADGTMPSGTVYFIVSDDVRSRSRAWQFPMAAAELTVLGIRAAVTNSLPGAGPSVLGVMMGTASVDPRGLMWVPGGIGEHLTSMAGILDVPGQTKLSAWIRSGATASAGTVTEPLSIWSKFPNARVFAHLRGGGTLIEALHEAIRCPLQILLVGEPLAAPWAERIRLDVQGLPETPLAAPTVVRVVPGSGRRTAALKYLFLVDGVRVAGPERRAEATLVPAGLAPGSHTLRIVAYGAGPVRAQSYVERTFAVAGSRPGKG
jgi:hypothetical protein